MPFIYPTQGFAQSPSYEYSNLHEIGPKRSLTDLSRVQLAYDSMSLLDASPARSRFEDERPIRAKKESAEIQVGVWDWVIE